MPAEKFAYLEENEIPERILRINSELINVFSRSINWRKIIAAMVPSAAINWFSVVAETKTPIAINALPMRSMAKTLPA